MRLRWWRARADRLEALKKEIAEGRQGGGDRKPTSTDRTAMARRSDAAEKALRHRHHFGQQRRRPAQDALRATEVPPEEWRRVLSTDLDAVFYWRAGGRAPQSWRRKKQGAIVNIARCWAWPSPKVRSPTAVAKAGVVQATKALALELAFKGVRVNAIRARLVR